MPVTDGVYLQDKKISDLEEKLQPQYEPGELPQTRADFDCFFEIELSDLGCSHPDRTDELNNTSSLEQRCDRLQNQVWEMEVRSDRTFNLLQVWGLC